MKHAPTSRTFAAIATLAVPALVACGAPDGSTEPESDGETGRTAQAFSEGAHGYVWADNSTGVDYIPATYFNSTTFQVRSTNTGTGTYRVDLSGLGGPLGFGGNVHVVAKGTNATRCKVHQWNGSPDLQIFVRCHTAAGAAANSQFVVVYSRSDSDSEGNGAYLWADQLSAASYNPTGLYSWNSTGGTNRITRAATGNYDAFLPGLALIGGTVQVTAYGTGTEYCKVGSWGPSGTDQKVNVRCFSQSGAAVDTRFTLKYDDTVTTFWGNGAHVWAHDTASASYPPAGFWSFNSAGAANTAGRTAAGRYFVLHPSLGSTFGVPFVTSYGTTTSHYCKLDTWLKSGTTEEVRTRCFTRAGAAVDTQYAETYLLGLGT